MSRRPLESCPCLDDGLSAATPAVEGLHGAERDLEAAVLNSWLTGGHARVAEHWSELESLVGRIGPLIEAKRYGEAALAAQIAANHAVLWHSGVFVHPELERLLRQLAEVAIPFSGNARLPADLTRPLSILHVATELGEIGGHARMMTRWIRQDRGNVHSVALTRQNIPVPGKLGSAAVETGGRISRLNRMPGGLLAWACGLQKLMAKADLVILHAHSMDTIPMLALAGMKDRPPVALLNHADHLFWLGGDFVDHVVHTRRSGLELSIRRRGIEPARNVLLPLCLEPAVRSRSREEAKKHLNLPPDCVVLLTIARAVKFQAVGGATFADALVPVLRNNPQARLIAVGPGQEVDWSAAEAHAPGQIRIVGQTPDTGIFLEAADIYVDSFPFVSITSLFEAGLHGLPLVTRTPFGEGCAVMGADSPGLDDAILRPRSVNEYQSILSRLVRDSDFRTETGMRTKAEIEAVNTGARWQVELSKAYRQLLRVPRSQPQPADFDARIEKIDLFIPRVYGHPTRGDTSASRLVYDVESVLKTAPLGWRLRTLARLAWQRQLPLLEASAWRFLIPEWLGVRIRTFLPKTENARPPAASRQSSVSASGSMRAQIERP